MGKDGKSKSHKSSRSKDKKHKSKHNKNEKKDKSRKRRREYSSDSDSATSSSGCDATPTVNVNTQLAMGRSAARAIREILAYKYELRGELRQLARHLDSGNALDISGLDDAFLLSRLQTLFGNLLQLKKTSVGHYLRLPKSSTVTSFVAPFLEESPASLASYAAASAAPAEQDKRPQSGSPGADPTALLQEIDTMKHSSALPPESGKIAPQEAALQIAKEVQEGNAEAMPPAVENNQEQEDKPSRRVLGPSMPPPEVLIAAAAMKMPPKEDLPSPANAALPGDDPAGIADDDIEDLLVGPPPPEFASEIDDAASMDDRSAEVARVLEILSIHEAEGPRLAAPAAAAGAPEVRPPDAYIVLGVPPDAAAGEIKKRYWRLSLLIHPDKCDHPQAARAFQAVAAAAQMLQDAAGRAVVDKRREAAELERFTQEYAAQQERERQWRIARGQATAEDLAGPTVAVPVGRDTWMTDLPEAQGAATGPPRGNVTAFSARGPTVRGDTSGWTMTPEQRAAAAQQGGQVGRLGTAAGPGLLMSGADAGRAERAAAVVDRYNSATRAKSLLEQHMEKQEKQKGKGAGGGKGKPKEKGAKKRKEEVEEWDRSAHPWRPFDREKDLERKPQGNTNPQELLKNMKGLSSRFGGGSGNTGGGASGRSFL